MKEIKEEDINYEKTFSPLRKIILFDDEKWDKFLKDGSPFTLGCIEKMFSINEIFPFGLRGTFSDELGKFMASLDTFQVTLSFLHELEENAEFRSVISDYRMSIQNFQVFMEKKSYYSALMEFRKMIEGLLWLDLIGNKKEIPSEITRMDYQEKLREVNPKFGNAYSKLNNLFHFKNTTPFFNLNPFYEEKDHLYDYLILIDGIADLYEEQISIFINSFESKTMTRYSVLLDKLKLARESYKLRNYPITPTTETTFLKGQDMFLKLIKKNNHHTEIKFKMNYEQGIEEIALQKLPQPPHDGIEYVWGYMAKEYDEKFNLFTPALSSLNMMFHKYITSQFEVGKNEVYILTKEICVMLMRSEIEVGGSKNIAFLRTLFEDICFNSAIKKNSSYMHTSLISSFLLKKYDIELKVMPKRLSHILRDNRVIYNVEEKTEEQLEQQQEYRDELMLYLNKFKNNITKIKEIELSRK